MLGVIALAVLTWGLNQGGFSGGGRDGDADPSTLPAVALTSLPVEAQQTVILIDAGGPFPYDRDGSRVREPRAAAPQRADRLLPRVHRDDAGLDRPWRTAHHHRQR